MMSKKPLFDNETILMFGFGLLLVLTFCAAASIGFRIGYKDGSAQGLSNGRLEAIYERSK